jgi:2'-5' RNA ligase
MRKPRAPKRLDRPHFVGSGIIIPPMKPGWKRADITQFAALEKRHEAEAELVYNHIATTHPHLAPGQWEQLMAGVLSGAFDSAAPAAPRRRAATADKTPTEDEPSGASASNPYVEMNGGMVCLYPDDPEAIAARTAGAANADPAHELHVTVAYVAEDAAELDDAATDAIRDAARAGARIRSTPLDLTVVGYGTLGQADPPATVLYLQSMEATAHRDGAGAVAEAVRGVLDDHGADAFPPEHDMFVCHMTIGYGVPVEAASQFAGETIRFSAGVSTQLGAERTDYPWGAAEG